MTLITEVRERLGEVDMVSELRARTAQLESILRELHTERQALLDQARSLEHLTRIVEVNAHRGFWPRLWRASGTVALAAATSALTFLAFMWFYQHGLLPWW